MVSINRKPSRPRPPHTPSPHASSYSKRLSLILSGVAVVIVVAVGYGSSTCAEGDASCAASASAPSPASTGRYHSTWEEAPASAEEFDHDNDENVCRLSIISVDEWESGRHWEGEEPVIVRNVTDGWRALEHWTK